MPSSGQSGGQCLCKNPQVKAIGLIKPQPVATVISSSETLNMEFIVDQAHSASSYFKHPGALFEAR